MSFELSTINWGHGPHPTISNANMLVGPYLESQLAENNWLLYHRVAQNSLKVANMVKPLALQVNPFIKGVKDC